MRQTCFAIMPFEGFDDVNRILSDVAQECGLDYVRSDHRFEPGNVMQQVVRDIRAAGVVVADISGHNPNVFYELGVAHQIKGSERVVIIGQPQPAGRAPYDVVEYRHLAYTQSEAGREALRRDLPHYVRAAASSADGEVWSIIRGRVARTKFVERDLRHAVELPEWTPPEGLTIRVTASLTSMAISDREPLDGALSREYVDLLFAERDALRAALLNGATLHAVLNPPRRFAQEMQPARLRARYERLIGLLEGRSDLLSGNADADVAAMARCRFALSPVPMPNLLIIGDRVAYEGIKRGGAGGFDLTHCETDPTALAKMTQQFDAFFNGSHRDMVRSHPPDGQVVGQLKAYLQEALSHMGEA